MCVVSAWRGGVGRRPWQAGLRPTDGPLGAALRRHTEPVALPAASGCQDNLVEAGWCHGSIGSAVTPTVRVSSRPTLTLQSGSVSPGIVQVRHTGAVSQLRHISATCLSALYAGKGAILISALPAVGSSCRC